MARAPAGLSEPGDAHVIALELAGEDQHQDAGAGNAAKKLRTDVADSFARLDTARGPHPHSHGGIDVRARNGADPVRHRHHGEAESERNRQDADRKGAAEAADYDRATPD